MTFSTLPDTSFVNNVDLHQAPSRDGAMPQEPGSAPIHPTPPAARKPKPAPSWRRSARSRLSSRPSGPPPPRSAPCSPASPASARWPWASSRTRSPAATKMPAWQQLGDELQALLTPEDYASARRTTFTAFYTCAGGHAGDVRGPGAPGGARRCHRAGARLWHRELPGPRPGRHALHRRGAGPPLRADRPRAVPRPRHPHRTLPRHPPARGPHRRRHRQCAVRRPPAGLPRDAPRPA